MDPTEELPPKYKEGDLVYGKGGEEYEYVLLVPGKHGRPGGHLIRYVVYDDEGNEREVTEVRNSVFAEMPEPTRNRRYIAFEASLRADRDELLAGNAALRTSNETLQEEWADLTARLVRLRKLAPAMRRIEDFLDGKITHTVIANKYGDIGIDILANATTSVDDYKRKDTKLVALFGHTKGDLVWRVNDHYDGSGSWAEITPCTSMEHALEVAGEIIVELVAGGEGHKISGAMKWADANGCPFPDEARAEVVARQRAQLVVALGKDKAQAASRQQALDDFDAEHKTNTKDCAGPWLPAPGYDDPYGPMACEVHGVDCLSPEVQETKLDDASHKGGAQ